MKIHSQEEAGGIGNFLTRRIYDPPGNPLFRIFEGPRHLTEVVPYLSTGNWEGNFIVCKTSEASIRARLEELESWGVAIPEAVHRFP